LTGGRQGRKRGQQFLCIVFATGRAWSLVIIAPELQIFKNITTFFTLKLIYWHKYSLIIKLKVNLDECLTV